jgi:molybdopterin converting factor small subunit
MNVLVQFYAQLRDVAKISELEIDLTPDATVTQLLEKIYQRIPNLRGHDKTILVATGVEFVQRNYPLKPGETIAIMPPVQGG